jgi:cell division protein ZapE
VLCFDEFLSPILLTPCCWAADESPVRPRHHAGGDSNIPPDELYRNGLQRARFLPAIDAIKQHCDIMNVDAGIDYRCVP